MILYFSGGSPIVETSLKKPNIMPSAAVDVKDGKPGTRLRKLIKARRVYKRKGKK